MITTKKVSQLMSIQDEKELEKEISKLSRDSMISLLKHCILFLQGKKYVHYE